MSYNILTKIDREILRLDPEFASHRQWKDLVWGRSSIRNINQNRVEKRSFLASFLFTLKRHVSALMLRDQEAAPLLETRRSKLERPLRKEGSYCPPRYFSKGLLEKTKEAAPIPYLLIETNEISRARPVPGNSLFLRSLAKGKGVLKKNRQGLFYLDIDNRFILSLTPYLKAFNLVQPPYFNLFGAPEGAHIPVISPREAAFYYLEKFSELGQEFSFEIEGLYSIEPTLWPEVEQVWFFKVRSLELEALRRQQLLISKPGGCSFHIAIAVKPRQTEIRPFPPLPVMRINPAYSAA